ncbi:unnamed protein product [Rotaria magnacalcarata]|uniref:DYW domain-containing protein n=1 Tax=Rotaria magnacalcarata TaxID=392030 RepID=A0A815GIE0_9BILA|nr:unnamed protein product [Rotaria magnacalcarata]CAF1446852.1 unnamed protein product [Rotaria magnacalcarata]
MITKILNYRLTSMIVFVNRSIIIKSKFELGIQMKQMNDNKQYEKTLKLFDQHKNTNIDMFSSLTITQILKACAHLGDLQRGLMIYSLISSRMEDDSYISASSIHLFMECGDVASAQSLFDKTTKKTFGIYGAMMKGYIKNKMAFRAIDLFKEIKNPNEIITNLLFNACADLRTEEALNLIKKVSKTIPKSYYLNSYLITSLLDAFMKCKDVENAQLLFDKTKNKVLPMYGAMMKGYIENNLSHKAIDLFNQIKNPSEINIIVLFNACAQLGTDEALNLTKKVSKEIPKSYYLNSRLVTCLLITLMKCKDVQYAQLIFDRTKTKTLSIYGAMMKGYIENNLSHKAIDLFNQIKSPDEIIINLLFNACAQLGTEEALNLTKKVSKEIPKSFQLNFRILTSLFDALIKCQDCSSAEILYSKMNKSVISYGNLMAGFNYEKNPLKTLSLFNQMKLDHIEADLIIYLCVIKALSQIGDNSMCESIIKNIPKSFLLDSQIQNSLVDMWGKAGYVDKAQEIFGTILSPDEISYAAMTNSYGLNGMGIQAIEMYHRIPSELINEITNICVLNACSHSGLVDEARSIFYNIQQKTERIHTTMIDCLSRASLFEEAQKLIDQYEQNHSPVLTMYMSLLSGARNVTNSCLSQKIYDRMKKLFPDMKDPLISAAILLANVYASSGDIDKASDIRIHLHKSGAKKKIGLSWTSVNGQIFEFRAHDQSHPRSNEIYEEGGKISKELLEHGHQHDSSWITRPLNQDETVTSVLCGHSERLAIAWNFVANPNTSKIQITKNLRVCDRATKSIAAIRQCEIIVRDANRIHHFLPNGQCSCNDYF